MKHTSNGVLTVAALMMVIEPDLLRLSGETPTTKEFVCQRTAHTEPLQRFVGKWHIELRIDNLQVAGLRIDNLEATGTETCEWVLDGKFLLARMVLSAPATGAGREWHFKMLTLVAYDAKQNVYERWSFTNHSPAKGDQEKGSWNAETKTLTWETTTHKKRKTTSVMRFLDQDTYKVTAVVRNNRGERILGGQWKATRLKTNDAHRQK